MKRYAMLSAALACLLAAATSHAVVLTDNFATSHDYSGGNVTGTIWTGVLNAGNATAFNANTTNAGNLTIAVDNDPSTGWAVGLATAPYLYLDVTGDFTAITHYAGGSTNDYSSASLMIRGDNGNFLSTGLNAFNTGFNFIRGVVGNAAAFPDINTAFGTGVSYFSLSRSGNEYSVEWSDNGVDWDFIGAYTATSGPLTDATVQVGLAFGNYGGSGASDGQFSNFSVDVVPEPSSAVLLVVGTVLMSFAKRRKARREVELF